jgi:hypothetical protein
MLIITGHSLHALAGINDVIVIVDTFAVTMQLIVISYHALPT